MPMFVLSFFAKLGIGEKLAKVIAWIGLVLLTAALVFWWFHRHDQRQREIGENVQRQKDLKETVKKVEIGNATREKVQEDFQKHDGRGTVVYDQCLRTARTPENCKRFLPERPAD